MPGLSDPNQKQKRRGTQQSRTSGRTPSGNAKKTVKNEHTVRSGSGKTAGANRNGPAADAMVNEMPSRRQRVSANTPNPWQDGYAAASGGTPSMMNQTGTAHPRRSMPNPSVPIPQPIQPPVFRQPSAPGMQGSPVSGEAPVRRRRAPVPPEAPAPVKPQPTPLEGDRFSHSSPLPPIQDPMDQGRHDRVTLIDVALAYFERWKKWFILAGACVLGLVILISVIHGLQRSSEYNALVAEVAAYDNKFCNGVYVDDIHLGGMTQQEAWDAVAAQAADYLSRWNVQLTFEGTTVTTLNAALLNLSMDPTDALTAAWAQGHGDGEPAAIKASRDALLLEPFHADSIENDVDLSILDVLLQGLSDQLYIEPQNASIARFDANLTYPFVFNNEVVGRALDMTTLKSELVDMLQHKTSGTLELQATYVQPEITVEYLKSRVVCELSTVYTDISTRSTDNRNTNIRQALSRVNGSVVKPGETFSFNAAAGDRTLANGYKEAPEYVYSQEVMGIGGGVCQASTTVYQAAVYAGMTITDRSPHSMAVNYSPYGKDATVNSVKGHRVDLKFVNNTPSTVYIKSAVESKDGQRSRLVTRVTIYGPYPGDGVRYDFDVQEEAIPAPTEAQIVVDKEAQYVIYETEEYEYQKAKDGTKVTSYQVKYVNGVEQDRVYLDTDTYNPKPQILYVGASPFETQ